jgi:hypothetical protein
VISPVLVRGQQQAAARQPPFRLGQLAAADGERRNACGFQARSRARILARAEDPIADPQDVRRGRLLWIDVQDVEPVEVHGIDPRGIHEQRAVVDQRDRALQVKAVRDR